MLQYWAPNPSSGSAGEISRTVHSKPLSLRSTPNYVQVTPIGGKRRFVVLIIGSTRACMLPSGCYPRKITNYHSTVLTRDGKAKILQELNYNVYGLGLVKNDCLGRILSVKSQGKSRYGYVVSSIDLRLRKGCCLKPLAIEYQIFSAHVQFIDVIYGSGGAQFPTSAHDMTEEPRTRDRNCGCM